jgi:hypothetical protein
MANLPPTTFGDVARNPWTVAIPTFFSFICGARTGVPFSVGIKEPKHQSLCMYCGCPTQWFELPTEGHVHSWTVCYFAAQEFLKEVPFTLVLVEFKGVDTLFLSRLVGVERPDVKIGMKVKAGFRRKETWSVRDVYFVRAET